VHLTLLTGCGGDNENPLPVSTPSVVTGAITEITTESALIQGEVTSDGNGLILERGVVIRATPDPTVADTKILSGTGTGTFTVTLTNLSEATTYNIRTFATNSAGTAYGLNKSFNTTLVPTLTTTAVTNITTTSADCGGNIASDGGADITARGVCWDTKANPTILNNKTNDGTGTGSFVSVLTGLSDGTIYYVRSYATNSAGTAYGTQVLFTTGSNAVTDIDGNLYETAIYDGKVWMVNNLKVKKYNNGDAIPNVSDKTEWSNLLSGAFAAYNNENNNATSYGMLYNWYAIADTRGICPSGWHVATDSEWISLADFFGGKAVAGGKLKTTGTTQWFAPNKGGSNESKFNAIPGGARSSNGNFGSIGAYGFYWTATSLSLQFAYYHYLDFSTTIIERSDNDKKLGLSVRCVRN
jgi:uncharacterized protein (TIGR02145 family)